MQIAKAVPKIETPERSLFSFNKAQACFR